MKKLIITGAKGTVGQILHKNLKKDYKIIGLDLPDGDITDYNLLKEKTKNASAIIHLAMDPKVGFRNTLMNPYDLLMTYNVCKVANENDIKRVILFSSVHADNYANWKKGDPLKTTKTIPTPDSPYGASKVYMEALGKYYAHHGVEVICIRLGGVNLDDNPNEKEKHFRSVYLSHKDLVNLVKIAIEAKKVNENYELLYAVSNNDPLIHSHDNSLGWTAEEGTKVKRQS